MDEHEQFFQSLTPEDEQLIILCKFLYEGDWSELVCDLEARLAGKPFVFKLSTRIEEDLARIGRLRDFEAAQGIDFWDVLVRSGRYPELANAREAGELPPEKGLRPPTLRSSRGKSSKAGA